MNASEQRIADMHSVLNILNVLMGELDLLEAEEQDLAECYEAVDVELSSITRAIREGGDLPDLMRRIRGCESDVMSYTKAALHGEAVPNKKAAIAESIGNLESVFSILKKRLDELELRADDPDVWIQIDPDVFRKQFEEVFLAIARNSRGGYGIHFNLAQKEQGDYYIDLKVDTKLAGGSLWMPLRLVDILRDLTANARKYTQPGGKVALAIYQDEENIQAVVEDSGCGIPDAELEKVTEYGYRATNVRKKQTLGGGFGLTKAAWLVTSWGGNLTIQSELDKGTIIRLSIPNLDRPEDPLTCTI